MGAVDTRSGLEVIEHHECLRLLQEQHFGRLGVVVGGQPLIFPINYGLDTTGNAIAFRADPGTKLFGAAGRRVAFEIDGHDAMQHGGWSVLVVGTAGIVEAPTELKRLQTLAITPYAPGAKAVWMRIQPGAITGRRIPRP